MSPRLCGFAVKFAETFAMRIVVLATDEIFEEWKMEGDVTRVHSPGDFLSHSQADAFLDLGFEPLPERLSILQQLLPRPVIVNSVLHTLEEIGGDFIRINGWSTFLKGEIVEASAATEKQEEAEKVFSLLGKKVEWVPDQPGFITPRVVSMIINEAFFAIEEEVSSREDIDTAMKLGTNYPYGPFEWADRIGRENIFQLLQKLSQQEPRYSPAKNLSA
jgi:3-hydroxybutyryl-CoA dehydrogenase